MKRDREPMGLWAPPGENWLPVDDAVDDAVDDMVEGRFDGSEERDHEQASRRARAALAEARRRARPFLADPAAPELRERLPPDWSGAVEELDVCLGGLLEWLLSMPPSRCGDAPLSEGVQPSPEAVLSFLGVASAILRYDLASACSLAESAMALTDRLAVADHDCRFLFDSLAEFWVEAAGERMANSLLAEAAELLDIAQALATACGDPEVVARLSFTRAFLHWQRGEYAACLTELDTARLGYESAQSRVGLGSVLALRGISLTRLRALPKARAALERSLELLAGSDQELLIDLATAALEEHDELL